MSADMNDFEKAVNDLDGLSDSPECVIEWLKGNKTATVTFPSRTKFTTKVMKLAEEYPDEVQVCHVNKDGSIVAHIPVSYIKISHPRNITYSEEYKTELRERMKKINESR